MAEDGNKFISDDKISTVPGPVEPAGGYAKKPKPGIEHEDDMPTLDEKGLKESFTALFEGSDLSEDFKSKATLMFESAVHAASEFKLNEAKADYEDRLNVMKEEYDNQLEEVTEEITNDMVESLDSYVNDVILENLDKYLDYVVEEWASDNQIAIESGIKVEMAESFMSGLKGLFESHNVEVSEETVDAVARLEEEVSSLREETDAAINERLALEEEVKGLKAMAAFNELAEGMTISEAEKLKTLAENLSIDDIDAFKSNVESLKESFFGTSIGENATMLKEENAVVTFIETSLENKQPSLISENAEVNALATALNFIKK
jgi:hypothetical protein